jgi:L-rhamnose 1-dehydrogenase
MSSTGLLYRRVVVITGASQGIGRGIALGCAKQGARVVIHHLGSEATKADAMSLEEEIKLLGEGEAVSVGGDISLAETAVKVRRFRVEPQLSF